MAADNNSSLRLRVLMYPWFAMGHLTPFLHTANKLAERGHEIFFITPKRTQSKLQQFNLHPQLIKFIPLSLPPVDGLPPDAETSADIPLSLGGHLRYAMDLTQPTIESLLQQFKPNIVFFDLVHWLPPLARRLGIKSILYLIVSPASVGFLIRDEQTVEAFMEPPPGFPTRFRLSKHEGRKLSGLERGKEFGSGITFKQRVFNSARKCDAIGFKTCRELEGKYCEYVERVFRKPVFLAGPVVPNPPTSSLDQKWANWLHQFEPKTVIFCAFGSEAILHKDQFEALIMGLELTGFPFLAVLKPPIGFETIEEALPQGFKERIQERGIVHGGWVQQQLILAHPRVGCFVTHCGSGSLSEAMVNECQLVLLPYSFDHFINARLMGEEFKVGVEVERLGDGGFSKEAVYNAIMSVMEDSSELAKEVRANHAKWRRVFTTQGLEDSYTDDFVRQMRLLIQQQ